MKKGYRILLHKDIPLDLLDDSKKYCDLFIQEANTKGYGRSGGHGDRAFFRRGVFGFLFNNFDKRNDSVVFRRLSKNRRIFGILPINLLSSSDGTPINLKQCICAIHLGGTKVKIKNGFQEKDYMTYYEVGDIKG